MAIDSLSMAYQNHYESAIFLLGDRDFIPLIEAIKSTGKKTYGFLYEGKISRDIERVFDFRCAFNKQCMESWIKK